MEDEAEIRKVLCNDEGVRNLAAHIAKYGLNPLKRVAVIKHPQLPSHYVVHEGNRRLCALQLLRDPERAPDPAARRFFRRLVDDGAQRPAEVQCELFENPEDTRVWKSVDHEGAQGGIGTVDWDATQQARHNRLGDTDNTRPQNPNLQALAVLDYAEARGLVTNDERKAIAITTITRYLTNPFVRDALGLINHSDLTTNAEPAAFDAVLRRFLRDSLPPSDPNDKPDVHSRSTKDERKEYARKLRDEGIAPATRTRPAYVPAVTPANVSAGPAKSKGRSVTSPDKRRSLIPAGFKVSIKDSVLGRLVVEGKGLDPDSFNFASVFLTRAVLERLIILYARKYGLKQPPRELHLTIGNCVAHAEATTPMPKSIVAVMRKAASDAHVSYSPHSMGTSVHGNVIPTEKDIKRNWDTWQPAFEWIQDALK
jgi:spore germination cell wall hydrolase CwlJ-like protein